MSTLFFDGFDKGVIFKSLDNSYWFQNVPGHPGFPKYAFGGFPYGQFAQESPYLGLALSGLNIGSIYLGNRNYSTQALHVNDTTLPYIGTPHGFLGIFNYNMDFPESVETQTYLTLSGFPLPQSNLTFLNFRYYNLETLNATKSVYPHRYKWLSFCSGNNELLNLNIVKVTGLFLQQTLDNLDKYETIGIEVEQNGSILGTFDLNVASNIQDYAVRALPPTRFYDGGGNPNVIYDPVVGWFNIYPNNNINQTDMLYITRKNGDAILGPRWCHFEFLIDQSEQNIQLRVDGTNLPAINQASVDSNTNIILIPRSLWETDISITGSITYNNLRFYNRGYSQNFIDNLASSSYGLHKRIGYYNFGKVCLLDDLVLIDGYGDPPNFWLGPLTKIIPFMPPANLNGRCDHSDPAKTYIPSGDIGPTEWQLINPYIDNNRCDSSLTQRSGLHVALSLAVNDGDNRAIAAEINGSIAALRYGIGPVGLSDQGGGLVDVDSYFIGGGYYNTRTSFSNLPDPSSHLFYRQLNDGVGGIKLYNIGKKVSLDTSFVNVVSTGLDPKDKSSYINIGSEHQVLGTNYQYNQEIIIKSPFTNTNWTLSEVTGMLIGVKKLL